MTSRKDLETDVVGRSRQSALLCEVDTGPARERDDTHGHEAAPDPARGSGGSSSHEDDAMSEFGALFKDGHGSEGTLGAGDAHDARITFDGSTQGTGHRFELSLHDVVRVAASKDSHVQRDAGVIGKGLEHVTCQ